MQKRKSFLSAFLCMISIPVVIIIMMIDKPDYSLFNFVYKIAVPVAEVVGQGLTYPIRLAGRFTENIKKGRENIRDNIKVQDELDKIERITMENEILKRENSLLSNMLKITETIKYEAVVARIIHNNSFTEKQSFIIKSSAAGIRPGNVVISGTGSLLGTVSEKMSGYAKIQSVKDGNSSIPVRIAGTGVFGFLYGTGAPEPELKFLSDGDFVLETGMFLVTSGVNGNVPDGIPVGRIESAGGAKVRVGAELKNQESVIVILFDKDMKYAPAPEPDDIKRENLADPANE